MEEQFKLTNITKALDSIGEQVVTELRSKMKENNKNATGELSRTLDTKTEQKGETVDLDLKHLPYFQYVEYDTKPHWAPIMTPEGTGLLPWVIDKKIPTRESTGKKDLPTEKQVAYMVQRKIAGVIPKKKGGTKGTGFLRTIQIENFNKWKKEVEIAQMLDVRTFVEQPQNKIKIRLEIN